MRMRERLMLVDLSNSFGIHRASKFLLHLDVCTQGRRRALYTSVLVRAACFHITLLNMKKHFYLTK